MVLSGDFYETNSLVPPRALPPSFAFLLSVLGFACTVLTPAYCPTVLINRAHLYFPKFPDLDDKLSATLPACQSKPGFSNLKLVTFGTL